MSLKIDTRDEGEISVLDIRGDFDATECRRFRTAIDRVETAGVDKIVLNLRGLYFIGTRGLEVVRSVAARLEAGGGRLVLAAPTRLVARVLGEIGVSASLHTFVSEEDALGFLGSEPQLMSGAR